jgi:hypothetical protein
VGIWGVATPPRPTWQGPRRKYVNASTNIVDFQGEVDQTVLGLSHAVAQNDVQIALIAVPPIASNFT